jgi:hypothetical protein
MKKEEQQKNSNSVSVQYNPVKPFAFEAWKIWNDLTDAAQSLWEEYEYDFVEFCMQETKSSTHKRGSYPF